MGITVREGHCRPFKSCFLSESGFSLGTKGEKSLRRILQANCHLFMNLFAGTVFRFSLFAGERGQPTGRGLRRPCGLGQCQPSRPSCTAQRGSTKGRLWAHNGVVDMRHTMGCSSNASRRESVQTLPRNYFIILYFIKSP